MVKKSLKGFKLYDAFPLKKTAVNFSKGFNKQGSGKSFVKKIPAQAGGRLKYGVFAKTKF